MVFIPRITFKTGVNPSLVRSFPVDGNYTGTQKLMLTASRIFGSKIGYINIHLVEPCVLEWLLSVRYVLAVNKFFHGEWIPTKCIDIGRL